ncbi:uncharacterized protein LOC105188453 [Harpegnathos saltator]|uniref:uncharacterized protein LOC105188453 n=1 Tax=Harpegnathos saltator TaxID=610380 RepID=UPI00059048A3|nr:uncharacterized protein LOC105188453 [Harpegnathos saltator]XP_011148221.1 uncharacterized protein LOC105188453 [Harpegnathos saltator]
MSDNLLTKENKFHKVNQDLQLKMHDIMMEINSMTCIKANNKLLIDTKQLHTSFTMKDMETTCPGDKTSNIDEQLIKSLEVSEILSTENISDTEISSKKYNLGNEAIIKLFKGKIDILHKKLQTIQLEHNKKCEYSKQLEVKNKKLDETQVKLYRQIELLSNTIAKLESTNCDIFSKCQALSNENIVLEKDLYSLKTEIKTLRKQISNFDIRLNRSLESNGKLRSMLKSSQLEGKELRDQIKKLLEDKNLSIKNLEKQRLELMQAFKKQVLLVDNLKRQNIYLMASGKIHLTREDLTKLLEWKPQRLSSV